MPARADEDRLIFYGRAWRDRDGCGFGTTEIKEPELVLREDMGGGGADVVGAALVCQGLLEGLVEWRADQPNHF